MSVVLKKNRIKRQGENWQTLVAIGRDAPLLFIKKNNIALNIKLAFKKMLQTKLPGSIDVCIINTNLLHALKNCLKNVTSILKNYGTIQK